MNVTPQLSRSETPSDDFSRINLVHVVRQYAPMVGGLEDFVRNLVQRQAGRFANVEVVTLDRLFTDLRTVLPARESIDGITVSRIPFRGSTRYPIAPAVFSKVRQADLVHVHAIDFFFDALAFLKIWHRTPLVATTHGGFFHTQDHSALKKVWFNTVTRCSASRYGALACCSESDMALFAKVAPGKVRLIENGVDLEKFGDAASLRPQKRLVTIGRFSKNKGLEALLKVMSVLAREDPAWKLDIVGGASDLSTGTLLQLISGMGLEDNVLVRTGLSNEQLRELLGACSLFVSASNYEGFGIALIEAMSAGLPPVVHPNEAFRSLADRHRDITLADFTETDAAAKAIAEAFRKLEQRPSLREDVARSAQAHGWGPTVDAYDRMYAEALANTGRS